MIAVKIANSKILTPTLVTKSKKLELNKFKKIDDNYIYAYKNWSKCIIDVVNEVLKLYLNLSLKLQL